MTVVVLHAISDGTIGAVRFRMSGEFSNGGPLPGPNPSDETSVIGV